MRVGSTVVLTLALAGGAAAAQTARTATLNIYVVDVEGGNATLFVSPSGESLLIDSGNAGATAAVRDAERIMAAAKDAGLTDRQLDHHALAWRPLRRDGRARGSHSNPHLHRPRSDVQPAAATDDFLQKTYPQLYAKAQHRVERPGDTIAVAGLNVTVVASAGETIKNALPGAGGSNPLCANFKGGDANAEDPMSVATYVTFGRFRTIHLGDLTKNKEFELTCPNNRLGTVDVFLGLHHGVDSRTRKCWCTRSGRAWPS
jgi:hypothetical protein